MAAPNPGDVAFQARAREMRRRLGDIADAVIEVEEVFAHFQNRVDTQTAALLTLAAVLHHQPEEEL